MTRETSRLKNSIEVPGVYDHNLSGVIPGYEHSAFSDMSPIFKIMEEV